MKRRRRTRLQSAWRPPNRTTPAVAQSGGAAPAHHPRFPLLIPLLVVLVAAIGMYWRVVDYGFVYVDDDQLIVNQREALTAHAAAWHAWIRPYFTEVGRDHAYYRPLVTLSYVVDASLRGADATAYHRSNCLLHALTAGLLCWWLRRRGFSQRVAGFGGLAFAWHPALTEAVAWVPGRPDLLMTLCILLAWLLLPSPVQREGAPCEPTPREASEGAPCEPTPREGIAVAPREGMQAPGAFRLWSARFGHLLFWFLALSSKEAAVALPAVWLLERHWLAQRPWRRCFEPWLVVGWGSVLVAYLALRYAALSGTLGASAVTGAAFGANSTALLSSLGKLAMPLQLSVLAIPEDTWLWPGLLTLGLFGAAVHWRWLVREQAWFALCAYLLFMLPSLPATSHLVLENRLYLPAISWVLMVCGVAANVPGTIVAHWAMGLTALIGLGWRTHGYLESFSDRRAFAIAAVRGSPHSALAHKNLGVTLHLEGDVAAASEEYQRALALDAAEPVAHNNLGVIAMARGDLALAERELRSELTADPHYGEAHHNLAMVLRATGREGQAVPHWQASLASNPRDAEALAALRAHFESSDPAAAARYRRLLELQSKVEARPNPVSR